MAVITIEVVLAARWARWRFLRYAVEGESMLPAIQPGDFIVADRGAFRDYRPRPGDVVLVPDPRQPSRTLLKRVERIDLHGQVWLLGDNAAASTDSRTFGAVPSEAIIARARWRYWPLRRAAAHFGPT